MPIKSSITNFENKTVDEICESLATSTDIAAVKAALGKLTNLDQSGQAGVIDSGLETYILAQTLFDQFPQAVLITPQDLKGYKSKLGVVDLTVAPIFDATQSTLPDFKTLSFEQLSQSMESTFVVLAHSIAEVNRSFAKSNFKGTWENTIQPTADILLSMRRIENYLALVENIHMPASVTELSPEAYAAQTVALKQTLAQLQVQLLQNPNYYQALQDIEKKPRSLDDAQSRILAYRLDQAKRVGAHLPIETREALNEIKQQLTSLYTEFNTNMTDSSKSEALRITDLAALAGLPTDTTDKWKKEEGGVTVWVIETTTSNYSKLTQDCTVRATRQAMYEKFFGRAAEGAPHNNTAVFEEILTLRQQYAKLMGYENYTEMAVDQKGSFHDVAEGEAFLQKWLTTLTPVMQEQAARYQAALKADGFPPESFAPWDMTYYAKKLGASSSLFQVQGASFHLDEVRQEAFAQIEKLFAVRIAPKAEQNNVWNADVAVYQVFDQDSQKLLGEFYWDAFKRDGKTGTNFTSEIQTGELTADRNEVTQIPVCLFNTNFTAGTDGKPSTLTIRETQTVFHELGHVMHMILGSQPYEELSGVPPMQQVSDLLEVPSVALEAWLYEPETLAKIAYNKDGSRPALADIEVWRANLDPAKPFSLAVVALYGLADLKFHADAEHVENYPKVYDGLLRKNVPYQLSDVPNMAFNTFPHMATDEYPGVYYQYALPKMIAPLIFMRAQDDSAFLREAFSAGSSLTSAEFLFALTGQEIDKISLEPALKFERLKK